MEGVSSATMVKSGTNTNVLSPLLISVLGIVVTAMAIMAYHLLLVKYCIRRRAANADAAQPAAASPTGVDEKVLAAIPILAFSAVRRGGVDQEECVVCLGELEDEDAVRLLPNCSHAFHVSCIDQWFAAHTSCPLCRLPVLRQDTNSAPPSRDLAEDPTNRGGIGENCSISGGGEAAPSPMGQSIGLLRHCASLMTPIERRSMSRLKRSVSMDPSLVVIDMRRTDCSDATSFSSSPRGILRRSGSLSHFDSKWLRSFSWLRAGKASNAPILPL